MAITSVESYALRRAAIGLGDRLGLGLYNKGETTPLVRGTLQVTDASSPQHVKKEEPKAAQVASPETPGVSRLQAVVNSGKEGA